jgi:hypothetical protein
MELRLEPELTGDRAEAGKLAVRLLHWLYEHGKVTTAAEVTPSPGIRVKLEPSENGRFVRAWKA